MENLKIEVVAECAQSYEEKIKISKELLKAAKKSVSDACKIIKLKK